MCGIAAIFAYAASAEPVRAKELTAMGDAMAERGPDGKGLWTHQEERVGLAHRRLSIIDLSDKGAQPMVLSGENGSVALVVSFNGEIYNYRELRQGLERRGHQFTTNSDTEVLLHLYRQYGRDMVDHLRGMYAFALWDDARQGLFLARDPFGIKPLYYADAKGSLRAASQVKALLAGAQQDQTIDTTPNPAGHVGFFLWGYVPEPHTLYKGIRCLPAGTTLWADAAGVGKPESFFNMGEEFLKEADAPHSPAQSRERLHDLLADSLRHHLVSDVPVGIFLSSGIDSTSLAALAMETGGSSLTALTLGFDEYKGRPEDETGLAEAFAANIGLTQQTRMVRGRDFQNDYDALISAMDQPSIDGVNTYFVSKAARQSGMKVVLSGLGGDEMFGGYPSFEQIPLVTNALAPLRPLRVFGRGMRMIAAPILKHFTSPKYASLFEFGTSDGDAYLLRRSLFMPWEIPDILGDEMTREGWRELDPLSRLAEVAGPKLSKHARIAAMETTFYMRNQLLRDSDWAGMAHSLEIRVPLVDVELFRGLAPMINSPHPPGKMDLGGAPAKPLPDEILHRPKTGFSVPVRDWLQGHEESRGESERGLRGWARRVHAASPYCPFSP